MGIRDPRIDAYIAKQKEFAKPILTHLRDVVHAACPGVEETVKWSTPFFWRARWRSTSGPRRHSGSCHPVIAGSTWMWIIEAKREGTKAKRVAQAIEWIAEGKSRNWTYQD